MGNHSDKKKKTETSSKIGKNFNCPLCNQQFDVSTTYNTLNNHIIYCAQKNRNNISQTQTGITIISTFESNKITIGNDTNTERSRILREFNSVHNKEAQSFEEKIKTLRTALECIKVDWRDSHCRIEIDRENILKDSMKGFDKIDPYKELKINFKGEVSYDAGGIIREWFTVVIKELQSPKLNLFERGETNEFSYIINRNLTPSSKILNYFNFLGKIIAKALLDNITLNLCLNKIIYKMILNEKVKFKDLVFIDNQFYNSLLELKKMGNVESLCLYYVIESRDVEGNLKREELKEDGANELVTDIDDYIKKRIEYSENKSKLFVNEIKAGLYKIISDKDLDKFNSDEFELMINGQPFIDVEEWRDNTEYQGKYNCKHKVIKWFWEIMFTLSQEELGRFFQFCTGSSRVPIGGFSVLESNRGQVAKFCIVQANYDSKGNNYIKAHTCFNRIDLPLFHNEKQVKEAIQYVINNEVLGFGIE